MTQTQLRTLLKLTRKEKIELAQTLWEDVASGENKEKISDDHKEKLEKTLKNISSGKTKFRSWNEVKKNFFIE
jgi:putative addiction module component (TIGR02574 family)